MHLKSDEGYSPEKYLELCKRLESLECMYVDQKYYASSLYSLLRKAYQELRVLKELHENTKENFGYLLHELDRFRAYNLETLYSIKKQYQVDANQIAELEEGFKNLSLEVSEE